MQPLILAQAEPPAGGAAIGQVVLATGLVTAILGGLALLVWRHRAGRQTALGRAAALAERASGLPAWAALPSAVSAVSLLLALFGMYWDISLHIVDGRDAGPLANPAHYPILFGLIGVFVAGWLAVALPSRDQRPGPAPIRLAPDWYAPVGGVLIAVCGAFALAGFPLDDLWHRLFGQDVTLWGPTHLMMLGGAAMTLIGQAVLLREGMWERRWRQGERSTPPLVTLARRVALMAGLLLGLSIFQAEFDFGVPQYRMVFQPMLIALAAGFALVAARIWIGRGGALAAALIFLAVRGTIALLVGPVLGETTPVLPLYVGEAICVELVALALGRERPIALGAAGGVLAGTAGFASEWAWSHAVMPLSWTGGLLPEGLVFAAVAGIAGGFLGGLLGAGLRGALPRPLVARGALAASFVALGALTAIGLSTGVPRDAQATVTLTETRATPQREAVIEARITPSALANDAAWANVTSWQGGGLVVSELEQVSPDTWRSTEPVPVHGEWKASLRIQDGSDLVALPIYMPADPAIPAREVPARETFTREFVADRELLQREVKDDVPGWLWTTASGAVMALYLVFLVTLAWGVGRVARRGPRPPTAPDAEPRTEGAALRRRGAIGATT
ncbi:MAG TPA: hypothetical protein VE401_09685 [Solirubrobacterales bacterium]|nr:hypothetical protein [Solirubrobacterales bacterium]